MTQIDTDKLRALDERGNALGVASYIYDNRAAILAMVEENRRLREALTEIASMGYAGAPDIPMRQIARRALSRSGGE